MDSFDVKIEYDSTDGELYISNNNSDVVSYIDNYIFDDEGGK